MGSAAKSCSFCLQCFEHHRLEASCLRGSQTTLLERQRERRERIEATSDIPMPDELLLLKSGANKVMAVFYTIKFGSIWFCAIDDSSKMIRPTPDP